MEETIKVNAFYQYYSAYTAALALVISGMHYGWPSPSLPILLDPSSDIPITEDTGYWLANMPLFGSVVGSLSAPLLVDNLGRHKTIVLTTVPYGAAWIMIFFSPTVELILVARFIAGISDGWAFSSVPIYIGEISEARIRGLLGSLVSVAWIFGLLLINIIGSYCNLRETALVSCTIPIALFFGSIVMPESPYFLLMKGNTKDAKKKLETLRGHANVDNEISRIQTAIQENMEIKTNPTALFRVSSNLKTLFVLFLLRSTQELSGDSAITFYTQSIFKQAGSELSEHVASIIFFSIEFVITAIASTLVDKTGRRPLLIFSAAGTAISLLIEGVFFYLQTCTVLDINEFSLVPLLALFMFVICFSAGLKIIPLLMLGEVFPQNVKAVALCICDLYATFLVTSISKFFQLTRDNFGMHVPFLSFGVSCALIMIPLILCVPETKGKTLEEIQDCFKGRSINKKCTKNIKL